MFLAVAWLGFGVLSVCLTAQVAIKVTGKSGLPLQADVPLPTSAYSSI
jgi:hypothetical protein